MKRHADLLNRAEAAAYLGVSVSKLAHGGWGPKPLANYKRPVMYSKAACEAFLRTCQEQDTWQSDEANKGSTNAQIPLTGGAGSGSTARKSGNPRERQIAAKLRSKLAASGSSTNGPTLLVVDEDPS